MKAKKIILVVVFGLAIGAGVVYEHHRVAKLREYSNNMELLVGAQLNTINSYTDSLRLCREWCEFYRARGDAYDDFDKYGLALMSTQEQEFLKGAAMYDAFLQNTTIILRPDSTILLNIFGQLFEVPVQSIK